jgi:hypothetical protein
MNPEDVEGFLAAFGSAAEPVDLNFLWRPQLRDPADELMLEARGERASRCDSHAQYTRFSVRNDALWCQNFDPGWIFEGAREMSKSTYPLKLPNSVKDAAAELAKIDGVSLNQFIAAAVAEKVGTLRTASEFLRQRAGTAKPKDLVKFLRRAPKVAPIKGDERA